MYSRGNRRRLDHLTRKKKLQRKKMNHREAAQASRDRMKAKLDVLEQTVRKRREKWKTLTTEVLTLNMRHKRLSKHVKMLVAERKRLEQKVEMLNEECVTLSTKNETLVDETERLGSQLEATDFGDQRNCSLCQAHRIRSAVISLDSAIPFDNPLPQGETAQPAPCLKHHQDSIPRAKELLMTLADLDLAMRTTSSNPLSGPRVFCEEVLTTCWQFLLEDEMNNSSEV